MEYIFASMNNNTLWYHINNAEEIDTPALLVYPQRIQQNIDTAIKMVGDVQRLRPHAKTHKCAEVAAMMIASGIQKFKCATIAEAEMLAMAQARDVLLTYQPVGPKLQRLIHLIKKYPGTVFSCLVDNSKSAIRLNEILNQNRVTVSVYIDLNVGMNRTGILPGAAALELYHFCTTAPHLSLQGLHVYDGHISHTDPEKRKEEADAVYAKVEDMVQEITNLRLPQPSVIIGGSPTFSAHCSRPSVECSPGTFIYWDKSYFTHCAEQEFVPAAMLITRVISRPGENLICTDLGHKAVAAESDLSRRVFFPEHEHLAVISQSEEHLLLQNNSSKVYQPGDLLYAIPWHICPTVALHNHCLVVKDGKAVTRWKNIARDRELTV